MKLTKREKEVLKNVIKILVDSFTVDKIYLFGSRAKDDADTGADFDLAADSIRPDIGAEVTIKDKIDAISGLYSVDIIYLQSVEKSFKDMVLDTGRLIYDKKRGFLFP